jgi:hypothetical protein
LNVPIEKYDWEAVEQDFMRVGHGSRVSLKAISNRHGIPYQTVRRYAAKNEWHIKRWRNWIDKRDKVQGFLSYKG